MLAGVVPTEAVFAIARSGAGVTVKLLPAVVVPTAFVIAIGPVVAPAGTVAVIEPLLFTVNVELVPLNFTAVDEKKFEPVIETGVPTGPDGGVKLAIAGAEPGLMFVVSVSLLFALFGSL